MKDKYEEILEKLKRWLDGQKSFQRRILNEDNCVVPVEREEFRSGFTRAIVVIENKIQELEKKNELE